MRIDDGSDEFQHDVFLSYRRVDGARAAQWLHARLARYALPKSIPAARREFASIFLDQLNEKASEDFFVKHIQPHLLSSRALVVIVTPATLENRPDGSPNWVCREVRAFLDGRKEYQYIGTVRAGGDNLVGLLPADLHQIYPNIDIVDLRAVNHRFPIPLCLNAYARRQFLKLVALLLDVDARSVSKLNKIENLKCRLRIVGLIFAFLCAALIAVLSGFIYLQDDRVRSISMGLPTGFCYSEPRGSVVQRFENGWLLAKFGSNTFFAIIARGNNSLEWKSFDDPYRGVRVECSGEEYDRLMQRGFRVAVCGSGIEAEMLRERLGRPLALEGSVLVQFQQWIGGLLVVGLPSTAVGFQRSAEDQQTEFAALDTVFLFGAPRSAVGVASSFRVSGGVGGAPYCSAIWFRSQGGEGWSAPQYRHPCAYIRGERFYLTNRLSCDLGE